MEKTPAINALIDDVASTLRSAKRVLFITGAGISADSGLPTYRGFGGLYDREVTDEGFRIEEALSGEMFARHPEITWKYLAEIERSCRGAQPNAAHRAIVELAGGRERVLVFTQNVDGLHRQAGSQDLIEIHGSLRELACTRCPHEEPRDDFAGLALPPQCPACGAVMRPKVVLFGEALPEVALDQFIAALRDGFDMVFSIGTSSTFPYIVQPVLLAAAEGVPTVEINPGETGLSDVVDFHLPLGAAAAMQGIMARLAA